MLLLNLVHSFNRGYNMTKQEDSFEKNLAFKKLQHREREMLNAFNQVAQIKRPSFLKVSFTLIKDIFFKK